MHYFLKQAAEHIYREYGSGLSELAVVFPGRRSRIYMNKYFTECIEKPVFAPEYYTITELMEELSGLHLSDIQTLIFKLYEIYAEVPENKESLDDFYFYCEMLVSDFDEIDKYLVNPDDLFKNLTDLKELENIFDYLNTGQLRAIYSFWDSFRRGKLSVDQKSFLSLWESTPKLYKRLNEVLLQSGLAYEGMAYRSVAEKIRAGDAVNLSHEKYLFIGFNALNKAEDVLFSHLQRAGKASFYWDYDEYYTNNTIHEAGYFMRENIKKFPDTGFLKERANLTYKNKKIEIVDIPSNAGQASVISEYLAESNNGQGFGAEETAIVLADESILLDVLAAVPGHIEHINVSMGYPLKHSTVYEIVYCLGNLYGTSQPDGAFYYKDVLALLGNPVVATVCGESAASVRQKIINTNQIWLPLTGFTGDPFLKIVAGKPEDPSMIPGYILDIFTFIISAGQADKIVLSSYEKEFLYHAMLSIRILKELIAATRVKLTSVSVFRLILRALSGLSVPFSGEPLKGLQVMGILETRSLDFKNVILLSANESVIPRTGSFPTFIPLNLRKGFDLPVPEHRDAIYGYYFYRLIQRAEHVVLVYNSRHDGLNKGERSRFLQQLYYDDRFNVNLKSIATDFTWRAPLVNIVVKTDEITARLEKYWKTEEPVILSPSAINTYLNCSLKFYFRYIAGMKEPETVMEEIDPSVFGTVLHKIMEIIYKPYKGREIKIPDIDKLLNEKTMVEAAIHEAFLEVYFGNDKTNTIKGKNIIVKEIITSYVFKVLEFDRKNAPFRITDLEKWVTARIGIGGGRSVRIGGVIDRIDEVDGTARIIDYKTGRQKNTFEDIDSLFDKKGSLRNDAVFQILLYLLVHKKAGGDTNIIPGLYFVRDIFTRNFDIRIFRKEGRNMLPVVDPSGLLEAFEIRLNETLADLFDRTVPFIQTDDEKVCQNCPYNSICHRG